MAKDERDIEVVGFTFARGGSKGLPGKNLKELGGLSLVERAVLVSAEASIIKRHYVSSDSKAILEAGKRAGAIPIERPKDLATDRAAEIEAWKHAVDFVFAEHGDFDIFVSLPATAPLRLAKDVTGAIDCFVRRDFDLLITVSRSTRSPYFSMVKKDETGGVQFLMDGERLVRRQDAPVVYDIASVAYVTTPEHISSCQNPYDGRVGAFEVPRERAVDIDDALDFELAEVLWRRHRSQI